MPYVSSKWDRNDDIYDIWHIWHKNGTEMMPYMLSPAAISKSGTKHHKAIRAHSHSFCFTGFRPDIDTTGSGVSSLIVGCGMWEPSESNRLWEVEVQAQCNQKDFPRGDSRFRPYRFYSERKGMNRI